MLNYTYKDPVYIAGIAKILPRVVPSAELAATLFPASRVGERISRLALKCAREMGIRNRPCVRDLVKFPEQALAEDSYQPVRWGCSLVNELTGTLARSNIGHLAVAYNISSHAKVLPNLACQIAIESCLDLDAPPDEIPYHGCAAGLLALRAGADYCQRHGRASLVFCFDQCTWAFGTDLQETLRAHLLFADGGVAILLVPESLRALTAASLPRIRSVHEDFHLGDLIRMENGRFSMDRDVKRVLPALVSTFVKAALLSSGLSPCQIDEWSIHQGGSSILEELAGSNGLNLSKAQVSQSRELFSEYGNLSAPSCLLVFESFFNKARGPAEANALGAIMGFGAGYYFALVTYEWEGYPR